jgi:inositol transport system substrate-binding protein
MKRLLAACMASVALPALMAVPATAETLDIGVSMSRAAHQFLVKVSDAMKAEAAAIGDIDLQIEDAEGDVSKQLSQVQNFVARGVDAIIVNAADTAAVQPITSAAVEAGIPLIYVNLGPEPGTKLPEKVVVVVSDHTVSGRLEAEGLVECMKGKGDVAIMMGELASNATDQRTAGNKEVFAKHPDIKVVLEQTANYQRNQAIDLMTNWITTGAKFDAIAANNDEMAIGAIFAMEQAGIDPKTVCVGGIDATSDALEQMRKGNLDVTVFQDAAGQGKGSIDAAVKLIKGEPIDQWVMIPYELVTPANMKDYESR